MSPFSRFHSHLKAHGKANVLIYAAPCCSSGHGPVPMSPPSGVLPLTLLALPSFSRHGIV